MSEELIQEEEDAPSPTVPVKLASRVLGVTHQCIHKWINQEKMIAHRYTERGQYRIPLTELDKFIKAGGSDPAAVLRLNRIKIRRGLQPAP